MLITGFFRNVMKVYDPTETKSIMVLCNINSFDEIFRKLIFSLRKCIYESPVSLVSIIVYICLHMCSYHTLAQHIILNCNVYNLYKLSFYHYGNFTLLYTIHICMPINVTYSEINIPYSLLYSTPLILNRQALS